MSRFRAASIHIAICAIVGGVVFLPFWLMWYPSPLFTALGGLEIFLLLLAVDVTLGPLLTLVVFKSGKNSLKFDLSVIGTLQVAALFYGLITLFSGRPVYVAALGHRFDVIQASEVEASELESVQKTLPLFGPTWVGIRRPDEQKERERIMFASIVGNDYGHFPQHHQPLENMREEILKNAQKISELKKLNPGEDAAIDRWIEKRGMKPDEVVFQGLKARAKDMAVILDAKTAKVIGIAPFKPWS